MTPDELERLMAAFERLAAEFDGERWNLRNITLADATAERDQHWRSHYRMLRRQNPGWSAAKCARMVYEAHRAQALRDGLEPFALSTVEHVLGQR